MFREIRTSEKITDKFEDKRYEFTNIKPSESFNMTDKEVDDFWKNVFADMANNE